MSRDRTSTRFAAFITKYALTRGILKMEVEDCFDVSGQMVRSVARKAKIAILKEQLRELETLKFDEVP